MNLFTTTLTTSLVLLALGALLLWNGEPVATVAKSLPRSKRFTIITFGLAAAWFLWRVLHLGEADFGNHRNLLFIGFGAIAVSSYFVVPDFLAIRGLTILTLLASDKLLDSAFSLYDVPSRLFLVVFAYLMIVLSIWLAIAPFRVRDFFGWLFKSALRPRIFGAALAAYGLVLCVCAFTY